MAILLTFLALLGACALLAFIAIGVIAWFASALDRAVEAPVGRPPARPSLDHVPAPRDGENQ